MTDPPKSDNADAQMEEKQAEVGQQETELAEMNVSQAEGTDESRRGGGLPGRTRCAGAPHAG